MSTVGSYRGPNIVTRGLVLHLDAASPNSYYSPNGGTVWKDVSPSRVSGSLVNSPTYDSEYGGSFSFSGTDDYITLGTEFGGIDGPELSFGLWFYFDDTSKSADLMGKRNGRPYNQYNMGVRLAPNNSAVAKNLVVFAYPDVVGSSSAYTEIQYTLPAAGWYYGLCVLGKQRQSLYVNGIERDADTHDYTGRTYNIPGRNMYIGAIADNDNTPFPRLWDDKIAIVQLYNRALSAQEVLQNYNATKDRFGL